MRLTIAARGGEKTSRASQPSGPEAPPCLTLGGITTQSPARITLVSSPTVNVSSPERTTAICCSAWWCIGVGTFGSKETKFVITVSVVTGRNSRPGPTDNAARSSTWTKRPGASEGSPDSSK